MGITNKNILLIELEDSHLKISAGFQDEELNFKIEASEKVPTQSFKNGRIRFEPSILDLKKGLKIIEERLKTTFTEANVITNQKNFDCINVSGFKK